MRSLVKQLLHILTVSAAMLLVSEAVLVAVFYLTGNLSREKFSDVAKVIDGSLASPSDEADGADQQPVELEIETDRELEAAVQEWQKQRAAQEEALAAERRAVESMLRELESVRAELDAKQQDLARRTAAFEEAKAAEEALASAAGFQEAVKTYEKMEARDVADLFNDFDDQTVVRYLKAFKVAFRAEVLTEIKKSDAAGGARTGEAGWMNRAARLQEIMGGGETAAAAEAVVGAAR